MSDGDGGDGGDDDVRARSATEMIFAASLVPCPACATREPARLELRGSGTSWSVTGPCVRCGTLRSYAWTTEGHPNQAVVLPRQLGDARPSRIIPAGQLVAELDRLLPHVREPAGLPPLEWRASLASIERALTCLLELQKHAPDGRARPQGELERLLAVRQRYGDDAPRIWKLEEAFAPPPATGAIDREALLAHARWVRAGRKGPGRLEVVGFGARGLRLAGVSFEGARLERVNLDEATLEAARMMGCELIEVSAREARCTSLNLGGATITRGTFARAVLALAVLDGARVEGTSFSEANLDRSTWAGACVTGASFERGVLGNAWLDGGRFVGCTFRGADLRRRTTGIACTTRGAVFEDCDLGLTRWEGRDLEGATFHRCNLEGARGGPASG